MKKQILIFAAALGTVAFVSCSKQSMKESQTGSPEEVAAAATQRPDPSTVASLGKGLICLYEFDGTVKDKTAKLGDVVLGGNTPAYTVDRKGMRGRAIKFTGKFGGTIFNVPLSTKMSLAFWVKYDSALAQIIPIAYGTSGGPGTFQYSNMYHGYNSNNIDEWIGSAPMNNNWHLLVVTMDGTYTRFYVDGNFVGNKLIQVNAGLSITNYYLGYNGGSIFWFGSMDDFRLYNRVLTSGEIQTLFNL
jgi:hypothetical protein